MTSTENMSREEKEALLNIRMEQIRKKNADLLKRYEEVQADKQNAETMSDKFQESRRGLAPDEGAPMATRIRKSNQPPRIRRRQENESHPRTQHVHQQENKLRHQRLSEDDGPPPDPSYRFLADSSREGHDSSQQDKRRGSRRHAGNYGGENFENVKVSIEKRRSREKAAPWHPPQNKMEMSLRMTGKERWEYDQWKRERSEIEQDRINRQKTASGEWRREWDREKADVDESIGASPPMSDWPPKDNRNRGDHRSRGNSQRGRGTGSRVFARSQSYQESSAHDIPQPEEKEADPTLISQTSNVWRRVEMKSDKSITMSISNDLIKSPVTVQAALDAVLPKRQTKSVSRNADVVISREAQDGNSLQPQSVLKSSEDSINDSKILQEIGGRNPNIAKISNHMSPNVISESSTEELKIVCGADGDEWDDEGSWEDATTSENESQECSQHENFVEENSGIDNDNDEEHIKIAEETLSAAIDADCSADRKFIHSNSREATPLAVEEASKSVHGLVEQQYFNQSNANSKDILETESHTTGFELGMKDADENGESSTSPVGDPIEIVDDRVADSAEIDSCQNATGNSVGDFAEIDSGTELENESTLLPESHSDSDETENRLLSSEIRSDSVILTNSDNLGSALVVSAVPDSTKMLLDDEVPEQHVPDSTECDSGGETCGSIEDSSEFRSQSQAVHSTVDFSAAEVVEISVADSTVSYVLNSVAGNNLIEENAKDPIQESVTSENDEAVVSSATDEGHQQHGGNHNETETKINEASETRDTL